MVADQIERGGVSLFKHLLDPPFAVFAGAPAFFLCQRSKKRNHQFAGFGQRIDALVLEINPDAPAAKLPDRCQQGQRVSCKTADGLGDDPVDLSGLAVLDHLNKAWAVIFRTGVGFIGVDAGEGPVATTLDVFVVVADLSGERMLHCILVTGNTGIGRNPQQFPFSQLHWLNQLNGAFHLRYPLS